MTFWGIEVVTGGLAEIATGNDHDNLVRRHVCSLPACQHSLSSDLVLCCSFNRMEQESETWRPAKEKQNAARMPRSMHSRCGELYHCTIFQGVCLSLSIGRAHTTVRYELSKLRAMYVSLIELGQSMRKLEIEMTRLSILDNSVSPRYHCKQLALKLDF